MWAAKSTFVFLLPYLWSHEALKGRGLVLPEDTSTSSWFSFRNSFLWYYGAVKRALCFFSQMLVTLQKSHRHLDVADGGWSHFWDSAWPREHIFIAVNARANHCGDTPPCTFVVWQLQLLHASSRVCTRVNVPQRRGLLTLRLCCGSSFVRAVALPASTLRLLTQPHSSRRCSWDSWQVRRVGVTA